MKKFFTLILFTFFGTSYVMSQFANVQVIHNSADAAAASVDVYVEGNLLFEDFEFRTASEFIAAPAGLPLNIGIAAAGSSSVNDTIVNFVVGPLTDGEDYIVVANGIVDGTNYNPAPAFGLDIYTPGQQSSGDPGEVAVLVNHGSTDAPSVNVVETAVGAGTLISDISYGEFQGYANLPVADYILEIQDLSGNEVISFGAPLALFGLGEAAIVVVASGFLDPLQNNNGPGFGLFVALPSGGPLVELPVIGNARMQFIHNSPEPILSSMGFYVNGDLVKSDFDFRTATPYLDVPSGFPVTLGVDITNDGNIDEEIQMGLFEEETYNFMFTGVFDSVNVVNPDGVSTDVDLVGTLFYETASAATEIDFIVVHGVPDAPTVDVELRNIGPVLTDLIYKDIDGVLSLADGQHIVDLRVSATGDLVSSYNVDLTGLGGNTAVVFASGLMAGSPDFGLFAALPDGTVVEFDPLGKAAVQIIHNSADAAAESVDIYINNDLVPIEDLEFRQSTQFLDLDAGIPVEIGIAAAGSTGPADIIQSFNLGELTDGETYIVVANGILSSTGYDPSPPLELHVFAGARTIASNPAEVDLLVYHGATDAPAVDVAEIGVGAGVIVDNISYSEFEGYLSLDEIDYIVEIRASGSTDGIVAYSAPLNTLEFAGSALTVVASGFLDPEVNSGGPAFGLWVATTDGGNLIPLPLFTSVEDFPQIFESMSLYPNPAANHLNVNLTLENSHDLAFSLVDAKGRTVLTQNQQAFESGNHTVSFNIQDLSAGQYFMTILSEGELKISKPVVIQ